MMDEKQNTLDSAPVQAEPLDIGLPWAAYCANPLEPDSHFWNLYPALEGLKKGDIATFWANDGLSKERAEFAAKAVNAHNTLVKALRKAAESLFEFEECFALLGRQHLQMVAMTSRNEILSALVKTLSQSEPIKEVM